MPFHDIAGNGRAKAILRMALGRDRVPNSLLFVGPRGVGKRRTARVLAQALNCLNMKDDACGECGPCRAIEARKFPDVLDIDALEDKSGVGIDQVRELRDIARLRPMSGRCRVFILPEDMLEDIQASAFLKILEEPPIFAYFILISENPALILPTINSRCQTITFQPVSDEEIEKALLERGVPASQARVTAIVCRGNLEKALEMNWDEIQAERREAWRIFSAMAEGSDPAALLRLFGHKREGEKRMAIKDELAALLELLSTFGRDAVLLGEGGDPGLLINPDFETQLRSAAAQIGPGRALRLIGLLHGAAASLDRNGHFGALTTSLTAQWLRADEA